MSTDINLRSPLESDHAELVHRLAKNPADIVQLLDKDNVRAHILHMAVGIAGEAGELLDAVKKYSIYGKPLDLENVIEELGDLEFYMQGLRESLNISRLLTLSKNIAKLSKRYSSGSYSDTEAIARQDKSSSPQE